MTRRRVTLLVPGDPARPTGGNVYDRRIAEGLDRLGWECRLWGLRGRFPDADAEARASLLRALRALPDGALTVVDGLALGMLPEVAASEARRLRLVALVHHPLADETGLDASRRRRFADRERRALTHARHVIVTSPFTARRLRDAYGVADHRLTVAEPGCDRVAAARGSGSDTQHWLCVAAVIPRKGHDVLLQALAMLPPQGWCCTCVGTQHLDPDHARAVLSLHARLGLGERVHFAGEVAPAALAALWQQADAFVLATRYEGYGMAFAEAIAHALPVIATTGGAVEETLPPGTALLAAPNDARDLAAALRRLLDEPPLRAELRAAARAARARFADWPQACARFARALEAA